MSDFGRTPDGFGWPVRIGLAFGVLMVIGLGSLFVLSLGLSQVQEDICPQRSPIQATDATGPYWVGPTTFECVYGNAPDLTFQDAVPLLAYGTVLSAAAGVIAFVWYRLLWRRFAPVERPGVTN